MFLCSRQMRNLVGLRRKCDGRYSSTLPLEGIRILDLTRVLAGPFATMVLGDLGAEVIKVERPGNGDDTRSWGPPFQGGESIYFMSINRNKKSICIDFKKEDGLQIIENLATKCDVLIENFLPGKLEEIGLGYEQMKCKSPHLIYCSLTGYGQTGPYMHKGGYDIVASAIGGLMHITGPEDGDPCRVGVAITDITTGLYAHGAIMSAIIERQRTGRGKFIDCSLLSTQVAVLSHLAASYLNAKIDTGRLGTAHQSIVPYQSFKTRDGRIVVGTGSNRQFHELCKAMDREELSSDERFADNSKRVNHRKILISILEKRFQEECTRTWLDRFDSCSFPCGAINSFEDVFNDPQVKHLDLVDELRHVNAGDVKVVGPAVAYDGRRRLKESLPPPSLGEHTLDVLTNVLGYKNDEIERLQDTGVIFVN